MFYLQSRLTQCLFLLYLLALDLKLGSSMGLCEFDEMFPPSRHNPDSMGFLSSEPNLVKTAKSSTVTIFEDTPTDRNSVITTTNHISTNGNLTTSYKNTAKKEFQPTNYSHTVKQSSTAASLMLGSGKMVTSILTPEITTDETFSAISSSESPAVATVVKAVTNAMKHATKSGHTTTKNYPSTSYTHDKTADVMTSSVSPTKATVENTMDKESTESSHTTNKNNPTTLYTDDTTVKEDITSVSAVTSSESPTETTVEETVSNAFIHSTKSSHTTSKNNPSTSFTHFTTESKAADGTSVNVAASSESPTESTMEKTVSNELSHSTKSSHTTSEPNPSTSYTHATTKPKTEVHTTEQRFTTSEVRPSTMDMTTATTHPSKGRTTTYEIDTTTDILSTKQATSVKTTEVLTTKLTSVLTSAYSTTTMFSCPTNMVYMNCTCQTTCADPNRLNGCYNCTDGESCVCPAGFYLKGEDCVQPQDCGCYFAGEGVIIQEGDVQLMLDCTQECSCSNGVLSCSNYQCDTNARCENTSNSLQCYCNDGYHGDGVSCTRLTDCSDVYDAGLVEENVYTILPTNWPGIPFQVYCKQGWTIFQRREDGSVDFYRNWADYKNGFGDLRHEMWLGLEKLYYLTNQGFYKLKISLVSDGTPYEINHSYFKVNNEANNYALQELGSYSGNIGFDYMTYHYSYQFSTYDRDNDNHNSLNCAINSQGGWWYVACWNLNLNGRYDPLDETAGVCLNKRGHGVKYCNIPFTEMSIQHV